MKRYLSFLASIYRTPAGVIALTVINVVVMVALLIMLPVAWGWTGFVLWLILLVLLSIPLNLKLIALNDPENMNFEDPYAGRNYVDRR